MPRSVTIPKRLVPIAEGASYRHLTIKTLRNWIVAGLITGYRVGPKLMFVDLDEIDAMTRPVSSAAGR